MNRTDTFRQGILAKVAVFSWHDVVLFAQGTWPFLAHTGFWDKEEHKNHGDSHKGTELHITVSRVYTKSVVLLTLVSGMKRIAKTTPTARKAA